MTDIQTYNGTTAVGFVATRERIDLIKRTVFDPKTPPTDAELELFIYHCERTQLDPMAKQIYAVKYRDRMAILTGIDGFRLIAKRTGKYRGQKPTQWCGEDGVWANVWLKKGPPAAAKVGVLHADFDEPVWAVALFSEYHNSNGQWPTMPALMLGKCAESLALRKAFPHELSGLYSTEEMGQAANEQPKPQPAKVVEHAPKVEPAKPKPTNGAPKRDFGPFVAYVDSLEMDHGLALQHLNIAKLGEWKGTVPEAIEIIRKVVADESSEMGEPEVSQDELFDSFGTAPGSVQDKAPSGWYGMDDSQKRAWLREDWTKYCWPWIQKNKMEAKVPAVKIDNDPPDKTLQSILAVHGLILDAGPVAAQ